MTLAAWLSGQALLAGGYSVGAKLMRGERRAWVQGLLILLLPVWGLVLVALLHGKKSGSDELPDLYAGFRKQVRTLRRPSQEEYQLMPVVDVLKVQNSRAKRGLVGHAVQKGLLHSAPVLSAAVRDSDQEVAHYAVSVLTHRQAQVERQLRRAKDGMNIDADAGAEWALRYVDLAAEYRRIAVLDENAQHIFFREYLGVLEQVLAQKKEIWYFEEAMDVLEAMGDVPGALAIGTEFQETFPSREEPYFRLLSLQHQQGRYQELQETLERMKKQIPLFSKEAVRVIRFWQGDASYAS